MDNAFDAEPDYYLNMATLRIHGVDLPLDEITQRLGVPPTHRHRRGERRTPASSAFDDDAWHLASPLPRERKMTDHLRELWNMVEPSADYIKSLDARVDVFCGYRSNNGTGGYQVEPDALAMFSVLNVPFGVSVIVDSWLGDALSGPSMQ
jgi:hypothetical protein